MTIQKNKEYVDPSLTDILSELRHIKDYDSFMHFFDIMPTGVDVMFSICIFGVLYGAYVLLMGALIDNEE